MGLRGRNAHLDVASEAASTEHASMRMIRRTTDLLLAVAVLAVGVAEADPLRVSTPTELSPMTVGAALTTSRTSPGESITVLVGVRLLPGWHTYAQVPPDEPYVATRAILEPGPGLTPSGDWIAPPSVADAQNPQMKTYESAPEPLIFTRELRVANTAPREATLRVSVPFQTCNVQRCLPPSRRVFTLKLAVTPRHT